MPSQPFHKQTPGQKACYGEPAGNMLGQWGLSHWIYVVVHWNYVMVWLFLKSQIWIKKDNSPSLPTWTPDTGIEGPRLFDLSFCLLCPTFPHYVALMLWFKWNTTQLAFRWQGALGESGRREREDRKGREEREGGEESRGRWMKERRGEWRRGHFVGFDKRGAGQKTSVSVNILLHSFIKNKLPPK